MLSVLYRRYRRSFFLRVSGNGIKQVKQKLRLFSRYFRATEIKGKQAEFFCYSDTSEDDPMIDMRESITAKLCSFARAYHSNFVKNKIFDDYLAYDLMGRDEYDEIGQLVENEFDTSAFDDRHSFDGARVYPLVDRYITPIPISRIAFAENALGRFVKEKGGCQYVICGAGMDTFAFRNDDPDIHIFELDHPDTQRFKLERIKQLEWNIPSNVRYVSVDFSRDDMTEALKNAGFHPDVPTFFSILGVTYYLTLPIFEETLEKINRISTVGSRLVFDFPDETTFKKHKNMRAYELAQITDKLGEPMRHGFTVEEIGRAVSENGFSVIRHETPRSIQRAYFENRADGQSAYENIHFILAEKKETEQ